MKIKILTIFPKMFDSVFAESIIARAKNKKIVDIEICDLRKWANDKYKSVDDRPFGGGPGMIMKIEPIYKALEELDPYRKAHRILFTARGARIVQEKVRELSVLNEIILICGRYEGVDERVAEFLVDECISIGDFVLSGGEIPAMALTDAVVRLIPGVLGNIESLKEESFSENLSLMKHKSKTGGYNKLKNESVLEYPQYTRPAIFRTRDGKLLKVPEILLSGDHEKIKKWKEKMRIKVKSER